MVAGVSGRDENTALVSHVYELSSPHSVLRYNVETGELTAAGGLPYWTGAPVRAQACSDALALGGPRRLWQKMETVYLYAASFRIGRNDGCGHVWPRPDGLVESCGGPASCAICRHDEAIVEQVEAASGRDPQWWQWWRE